MHPSSRTRLFLRGTFILTAVSLLTRVIGFFYRIFLSRAFGAESVGLYQLIFPVYALCISLSSAGIQTALSRIVARHMSLKNPTRANLALKTALFFSMILALFCTFAVQIFAPFLSESFLKETRCIPLLKVMAYSFPFASAHACICGYYIGLKQTRIPAVSQLLEQTFRVSCVYILYMAAVCQSEETGILIAVCGLVFGEIVSSFYCIFAVRKSFHKEKQFKKHTASVYAECFFELFSHSFFLTANRIALNLLQSIEVISIPQALVRYGLSSSAALSHYGILNGIALPCILFPSAVTNSVSVMMLPTVAEIQAASQKRTLVSMIRKVSASCLFLGLVCTAGFLVTANFLGNTIFQSPGASSYIRTLAFICPFLYTNSTYISILNGLGQTTSTFLINVTGLSIRIAGVFFLIPRFGMTGYLMGMLFSQLYVFFCCILKLKRSL